MKNVILLRHGEALHNVFPDAWKFGNENLLTLTEKGYVQAINAAHLIVGKLKLQRGDRLHIVSSDLLRAQQTTALVTNVLKEEHGVNCIERNDSRMQRSLREFYAVFDGKRPTGFDFDEFLNDPFKVRFTERNSVGSFREKVRNPLDMLVDYQRLHKHVTEVSTNAPVLLVGHHFSLNIFRFLVHFDAVSDNHLMDILAATWMEAAEIQRRAQGKRWMESFQKLLTEVMAMPLDNAMPTLAFLPETQTPDNELLTYKIKQWQKQFLADQDDQLPVP
jgi:broad specificity phosphatase PhoE